MLPQLELPDLSPEALRALAEYLSKLSTELQRQADGLEAAGRVRELSSRRFDQAKAAFTNAGQMVMAYVEIGTPVHAAVDLVIAASGFDQEQVRFAYSLAQRQRRQNREIVISWLKEQGWTDAQIGDVVGLHEKSVTRLRNSTES